MPKTLLLADDSVTIQKVVGLTFANEDVVLVSVDNGDDAILKAREIRPDFVLADVVMPGRNGYEVCEALKSDPELRHVPVLLLSGTFETFDEERARVAGADGHITKPFEAQALVETVHRLLARAAAPQLDVVATSASTAPASAALPADGETSGSSFDFFDDDLLGESEVPVPGVAPAMPGVAPAMPGAARPASAPSAASTASVSLDASDATRVAPLVPPPAVTAPVAPFPPAASPSAAAAFAAPGPAFSDPAEATVLDLREEDSLDVVADDSDDDVAAAARSLFADDGDLEAAVGAGVLEDEEPLDLGLDQAPRLPAAPAVLDDPLEPLARSASGLSPRAVVDPGEVSWPGAYASSQRLGASAFDVSFRESSGSTARANDPFASAPSAARATTFDVPPALDAAPPEPAAGSTAETAARFDPFASTAPPPGARALELSDEPFAAEPFSAEPFTDDEPMAAVAIEEDERIEDAALAMPLADDDADDDSPFATLPFADPTADDEASPLAFRSTEEPVAPATSTRRAGATSAPAPDLSPPVRRRIHDTLEKVAWEAFADLSDTIVRQVVERVEQIAWEVIPQMAETLVREEIRRMKGDEET